MSKEPVWTTKDGRRLTVKQFDDNHLINARRYAQRVADQLYLDSANAEAYAATAPDGASMAAEAEAERMFNVAMTHEMWVTRFDVELRRRGLSHRV